MGRLVGIERFDLIDRPQVTEYTLPPLPTMPGLPWHLVRYCPMANSLHSQSQSSKSRAA